LALKVTKNFFFTTHLLSYQGL